MGSEMRTLAEDIVASHKWRESVLGSIRKEKNEILYQADELLKGFKEQDAERKSEIFRMKKEVAGMLGGFRKEMYAVSKERKKDAAAWHGILGRLRTKAKKEAGHGRGKKSEKSSSE